MRSRGSKALGAAFVVLMASGGAVRSAGAAPVCAGVSVTSAAGTYGTGTICQPTLLGNSIWNNACGGVPPAGVSYCYTIRVPRP